jgi:uncharacterized protein YcbK (DUF882 family)
MGEERTLLFYSTHTNEHNEGIYKKGEDYNSQALEKINYIFQDHYADKIHTIDPALLDYRYDLLLKVACPGDVHIISGYCPPQTNNNFRINSTGAAVGSLHLPGKELNFRLPGISTKILRRQGPRHEAWWCRLI